MVDTIQLTYLPHQLEVFFGFPEAKYVIVKKGRRAGITKGGSNAFIEWGCEGVSPLLWVDTINGNIDRYFERFFKPELKKLPSYVQWNWNAQKRLLTINDSIIDFRSADNPETIEGFGYKKIFLNEAGIILKNDYLYSNAILPMLLDYSDSQLIAAGVPKGKFKKDGNKHKFFELYENALAGKKGYKLLHYTSFDNKLLKKEDIDSLMMEMSEAESQQEIYGEFVEFGGKNPFAHKYNPVLHESKEAVFNASRRIIIVNDFNINPFAFTFWHHWQDINGHHAHCFDEMEIQNGSIDKAIEMINHSYERHLYSGFLSGDALSGNEKQLGNRKNLSLYKQLLEGLRMSDTQLRAKNVPTHENSRADVNYILTHFPDFKINPDKCPNTCRDMRVVQCDAFGEIIKRNRNDLNQRADFLDTVRYFIHNFLREWKKT